MEQSAAFNISTIAKMVGSDLVEPMLVSYQENTQAQLTKLITIVATQSASELHRSAHSDYVRQVEELCQRSRDVLEK
ncbi:hypothetical protein [Aeromonas veronii]|uniref:hypothetical protein n=1 Tax=Aeromonas veronii TaxID=654 RepID=UPI003B9FF304